MSSWKLGCREAWAGVCRTPSVPSRASPSHSELGVAILPERSGSAGRVSEAGRSIRGRGGDPYLWAWLGLHPGHKDSPLEPRDAGGEDRATEQGGSLAPRRAAYVSYRHGLLQAGGLPPPAERGWGPGGAGPFSRPRETCPCSPDGDRGQALWGLWSLPTGAGSPLTTPTTVYHCPLSKSADPGRGHEATFALCGFGPGGGGTLGPR